MSYGKLLWQLLQEKKMTKNELAEKSGISKSYISKIINSNEKAPKEANSRKIANALNVDEKLLVIEGYITNAPEEIKTFVKLLREITLKFCTSVAKKKTSKELLKSLKIDENTLIKQMREQPIANFILDFMEMENSEFFDLEQFENLLTLKSFDKDTKTLSSEMTFKIPMFTILVSDDGMSPQIPINSRLDYTIQEQYNSGDIVCIQGEKGIIARRLTIQDDVYIFTAENQEKYEPIVVKKKDATIIAKATKVTYNL